jgi:hypothetical protein
MWNANNRIFGFLSSNPVIFGLHFRIAFPDVV